MGVQRELVASSDAAGACFHLTERRVEEHVADAGCQALAHEAKAPLLHESADEAAKANDCKDA